MSGLQSEDVCEGSAQDGGDGSADGDQRERQWYGTGRWHCSGSRWRWWASIWGGLACASRIPAHRPAHTINGKTSSRRGRNHWPKRCATVCARSVCRTVTRTSSVKPTHEVLCDADERDHGQATLVASDPFDGAPGGDPPATDRASCRSGGSCRRADGLVMVACSARPRAAAFEVRPGHSQPRDCAWHSRVIGETVELVWACHRSQLLSPLLSPELLRAIDRSFHSHYVFRQCLQHYRTETSCRALA